jgi:hypothetical protein
MSNLVHGEPAFTVRYIATALICFVPTHASLCSSAQDSSSYSETLRILMAWDGADDSEDDEQISALFAKGEYLTSDLVRACTETHPEDEDIAFKSYLVLHLMGAPQTAACARRVPQENPPVMLGTADILSQADFSRLESLFRVRACEKATKCQKDYLPLVDESLVYTLILDGSSRSKNILNRMNALARASHAQDDLGFEIASRSETLITQARSSAHNLQFDPNTFEGVIRESAFFLASQVRQDAEIKLLARSSADNRMLISISYRCGMKCGSGYYLVLRKNSSGYWDYALIMRSWIA